MRAVRYAGLLGALSLLLAVDASAHRFGGPNDPCERKIGSSLIHITLYQPEFDPDAEYCDELPRDGNTVFVLDTHGHDLRRVPIGVEILALDGSGKLRPVLSIPPTIYKRGVVDAQLTLSERSSYLARVSVASSAGGSPRVYSFPIRVRPWYRALVVPSLMVLGVLALVAISIARFRMT